jgi:hypothetical protein
MARILTDIDIATLLGEPKQLPNNWATRFHTIPKSNMAFSQRDYSLTTPSGYTFKLVLRESSRSPLDFSVILVYLENGHDYILRRNNGSHPSRHTNKWEKMHGQPSYQIGVGCHIHMATERYQLAGLDIDGYAQATNRYQDFNSALHVMLTDCNFIIPANTAGQPRFPGM